MKNDNPKVDIEIYLVFMALIGISVFNAIYCSIKIEKNQDITRHVISVETPSIEALGQLNELVTQSKMLTTNCVYLPYNSEDKQKLKALQQAEYPQVKATLTGLMNRWKDPASAPKIRQSLSEIENLMEAESDVTRLLYSFSDFEDPMKKFMAQERVENVILPMAKRISASLNDIMKHKQEELERLHSVMQTSYRNLVWSVLAVAMAVVLVVLMAAFYLSHFMILPVMKLRDYIRQLSRGEIPDIKLRAKSHAVRQIKEAVVALTESFKTTARFAYEIGEGKFDAQHTSLGEHDELGNALIQMRDKLHRAQYELTEYMQQLRLQNDILHQARQELFEKAHELELANKYKSEFLANMSHELRTPLNSILVLANILFENSRGGLTAKEAEYARIIHQSGSDLLLLINDILDLSKIEAGRVDLIYESVRIEDIKAESFFLFDEIAKKKKIHFGIELSSGLPEFIMTDRLRIGQVIRNLLSNAFKFTEPGGEVMMRFRRCSEPGVPCMEVSVQDTGIGIADEQQGMIFEAFRQADGSISRKYGGTGLGLSITQMLTGLMGGSVTLKSKLGEGSTFTVRLPLQPPVQSTTQQSLPEANSESGERVRINKT